jgi:hypothetical protein
VIYQISIKKGVNVAGIRPEILLVNQVAAPIFAKYGSDLVITSYVDGKHSQFSRHYAGCAVDYRIWYLAVDHRPKVVEELQEALGDDYYVRLESDHIHVSYKPQYRGGDE